MPRTILKCARCKSECGTSPNGLCESCSATRHVNDNDQPSPNAVAFSDLALAMQVDEDVLLQRLAKILCREIPTQVTQTKVEGNPMHWEQRIANYVRETGFPKVCS